MAQANFVNGAGGNINPSTFVVFDTSNPKAVNQASGASALIAGVVGEYSKYAPIPGASVVAADAAGDPVKVYQIGDICLLQSTSLGWTAGDLLTSDSVGRGKSTTSSGNFVGAVALTTLSAAGLGQVQVVTGVTVH